MIKLNLGAVQMDHDQNLLVQSEMLILLDELPADLIERHPVQFLLHLDHIRQKAAQHRLGAVHDLSCAFEEALQPALKTGSGITVADSYLEAIRNAVQCNPISAAGTEAIMANVALRLGGQS